MTIKEELFQRGVVHITRWCELNKVPVPTIVQHPCGAAREAPSFFGTCAYYRDHHIHIEISACATLGNHGRQWSWPGYTVDRTPYGVLCHELGHHISSPEWGALDNGALALELIGDPPTEPISGYDDNGYERFAELFRLFVTNPSLLARLRYQFYFRCARRWRPIEERSWERVLEGAPRQLRAAENKIKAIERTAKLF